MHIGNIVGESFAYAKEGVWNRWALWITLAIMLVPTFLVEFVPKGLEPVKWVLEILSIIGAILIAGYIMEIYRGKKPAPEISNWGKMFVDGLKLLITVFLYMLIPILVLTAAFLVPLISLIMKVTSNPALMMDSMQMILGMVTQMIAGAIIFVILAIIFGIFMIIGMVRLARFEKWSEAFNFSAILATIGKIGWGSYILALIVWIIVWFILEVILGIFFLIPFIGWVITVLLTIPVMLFINRYQTMVYESAGV